MKLAVRRLTRRLAESVKPSQQKFLNKINELSVFAAIKRIEVYTSIRLIA